MEVAPLFVWCVSIEGNGLHEELQFDFEVVAAGFVGTSVCPVEFRNVCFHRFNLVKLLEAAW